MIYLDALDAATLLTPKQLTKQFGDEAARWALWQVELRQRARRKFGDAAATMLFEREALEQATQARVARYHASQFLPEELVIDLTMGIGGDAYWLAQGGPVIGFELSEERAGYARHNVASTPNKVEIRTEDGWEWLQTNSARYVWADPDRRAPDGKRLISPEDYQPNPTALAEKLRSCSFAGIKLSPMLPDDYLRSLGGRVEFVSYGGECCEAVVWLGESVEPGWRAVVLGEFGESVFEHEEVYDGVEEPGAFIYDCDPAVVRAHAMGSVFANPVTLGDSPGYLTGDDVAESPGFRSYEVLHSGSSDSKKLREVLRKNNWRVFEVKQRGAGLDPSKVMRDLKTEGTPVSLIAWRVGKSIRMALCRAANL